MLIYIYASLITYGARSIIFFLKLLPSNGFLVFNYSISTDMVLHKKLENHLKTQGYTSVPEFRLLSKIKTIYYCPETEADVVAHGIVVGIEYMPELTKKFGWWYKVLIYSTHISSEEHNKMFRKLKINADELERIEVMDIYSRDVEPDKANVDSIKLLSKLTIHRIRQVRDNEKSEKLQV